MTDHKKHVELLKEEAMRRTRHRKPKGCTALDALETLRNCEVKDLGDALVKCDEVLLAHGRKVPVVKPLDY